MPTFITLANFTDQGVRNFKDTAKRARAFMESVEQLGGKVKDIYWTLGSIDVIVIAEAPDDETYTAAVLKVGSLGNVRTTTLRAFGMHEIEKIINKAG